MSVEGAPSLWDQVADSKAALRDHVQLHRHRYRGRRWYVLQDRVTTRYFRLSPEQYQVVRLMDGERSLSQIREQLEQSLGGQEAATETLVELIAQLHANELLRSEVMTDVQGQFDRRAKSRPNLLKHFLKSPFLIRLPAIDPEPLLARAQALTLVFSPAGLVLWLLGIVAAGSAVAAYWNEILHYWTTRALAPYNLLTLCLVYPAVKGVHELAHALAVKRYGGDVRQMGVMLILLMPLPFVDASAASAFIDKHRRMLVGAAGIMAELALAALATLVWFNVETGLVRDVAFNVMLIGSFSTLFFNGNPLLKFDGYFVLMDAIEIPNLAPRSVRYYAYLAQRYLLGLASAISPVEAPGERGWFLAYGLSSFVYRTTILFTIVLFVVEELLVAGVILGAIAICSQLVVPLVKQLSFVLTNPALSGRRVRAVGAVTAVLGSVFAGLFWVPLSSSTYAQGVVWLPERAEVRAAADGFITRVAAEPNSEVAAGQLLFASEEPLKEVKARVAAWELAELEARYHASMLVDRAAAGSIKEQIRRQRADFEQARAELTELDTSSPTDGRLVLPEARRLVGRFVRKGDVLGYVTDLSSPTVRAAVYQADADRVRNATSRVEVRLAENARTSWEGTVLREVPAATTRLPSRALGTAGDGLITVDPEDPEGVQAMEEVFLLDIELPMVLPAARLGMRAHVRFEHPPEPLGQQWYRRLRQLFLSRFTV